MTPSHISLADSRLSTFTGLAPVVAAVFLGFLAVSTPLAALALQARDHLGFGPLTVGLVIGLQSLATLLSRHQSGAFCDRRGPRRAVLLGLPIAAASGLFYLMSAALPLGPSGQLAAIVVGRLLMGIGESLFLTGLMSIGIARLGAAHTGKVMSWTGIAIYAALGLGAPVGLVVQSSRFGFAGVGVVALVAPLVALALCARLPAVPASGGGRVPFHRMLGLIWRPGLVLALATMPYAAMAAFLACTTGCTDGRRPVSPFSGSAQPMYWCGSSAPTSRIGTAQRGSPWDLWRSRPSGRRCCGSRPRHGSQCWAPR